MKNRQFVVPLSIIALASLALYILIARALLRDPVEPNTLFNTDSGAPGRAGAPLLAADPAPREAKAQSVLDKPAASGGSKRIEVFGRVVDPDRQPLAGVLVAEERYFATARSDAEGYYRLSLELPRHRDPVVHFLRAGYGGQRFRLKPLDSPQKSGYRLDVSLAPALDSVDFEGWVGNDIGLGLEGARVQLTATYPRNRESFYLTDFTDENGRFRFDGVRSGETYQLSVQLSPEYRYYENPAFIVASDPAPEVIILEALKFVDVEGMLLTRDGEPVADYEIYVTNLSTGSHARKIVSDSSGYFALRRFPPGEISLSTSGPESYRVTGMSISEDAYQNLRILVDRGGHTLSGWITDDSGMAVDKAMVTIDRKFRQGRIEHTAYRSQSTASDGRFGFDHLGGGEHRVTVYAWGFEKQEFSYRFSSQADEIFVTLERSD